MRCNVRLAPTKLMPTQPPVSPHSEGIYRAPSGAYRIPKGYIAHRRCISRTVRCIPPIPKKSPRIPHPFSPYDRIRTGPRHTHPHTQIHKNYLKITINWHKSPKTTNFYENLCKMCRRRKNTRKFVQNYVYICSEFCISTHGVLPVITLEGKRNLPTSRFPQNLCFKSQKSK